MATQTFGVDADRIKASLPQIVIDSGTGVLLTTTRAATIINSEAARICGLIDGAFGEGTADEIAALGAGNVQYDNAERLVVASSILPILRASHHPPSIDADTVELREDLQEQVDQLISDPARALGRVNDETSVSAAQTRFKSLGLSTATTKARARRQFDGRSNALGVDEGGFQW